MTTGNFFNILGKYFHCCICRCCNEKSKEEDASISSSNSSFIYNTNGENSPFTFDDMSSSTLSNVTWTSSSSSLDSFNEHRDQPTYKRKNINISIIPSSYYYNSD
jgi:hypothetical protein